MLVLLLGGLTGCRVPFDPTESQATQILRNDLGVGAQVTPCEDTGCRHVADAARSHLAPGGTLPVNVSTEGGTSYRVDAPGRPGRCLALVAHGRPPPVIVPLSGMGDCPAATSGGWVGAAAAVLAWGLFFGVGALGLAVTALVTRRVYRRLRGAQRSDRAAGLLAALVGLVTFAFGWPWVVVYWLGRGAVRLVLRATAAAAPGE